MSLFAELKSRHVFRIAAACAMIARLAKNSLHDQRRHADA